MTDPDPVVPAVSQALDWHHAQESPALVRQFLAHPPEGFVPGTTSLGLPWFEAELDLTTTLEDDMRRRVRALPLYRWFGRFLRWPLLFVGSTVSEYSPLPRGVPPAALVEQMLDGELRSRRRRRRLLIVKDIPLDSPLLDEADRAQARAFIDALKASGFVMIEGQALAWVPVDYSSSDDYLSRLSSERRYSIRRKLRNQRLLTVTGVPTGDPWLADAAVRRQIYGLYEQVYAQSELHFDRLTAGFFDAVLQDAAVKGRLFVYREGETMVGWNLCFEHGDTWVDKYVGFSYPRARELSLYIINWMRNIEHARAAGKRLFVAGWTDPQVKAEMGARFTFTQHAVYPRNALLRAIVVRLASLFEGDRRWFDKREQQRARKA